MSTPAQASRAVLEPRVRTATTRDLDAMATAVCELLGELGAKPPATSSVREAAQALLASPAEAALLLAEGAGGVVGLLGASWQSALRVPGRYGLIQELWVHPDWRSRAIGRELLEALFALAAEQGIARVEVVLPGEGFSHLAATEAFYLNNGFMRSGLRLRRAL